MITKKNNYKFTIENFPTTRFQGSKRKILSWLFEHLSEINFSTVLDGFGGSSSVSYLFKTMNKEVTYNDKYRFNHLIGRALIENNEVELSQIDIEYLLTKNNNNEYFSTVSDNFSSIYYLDEENAWIDMVMSNILQMGNIINDDVALKYKQALAFYTLFQSCLVKRPFNLFHRKNLYIRTNDVKRTFGNKTTWDRSFEFYFYKFSEEANRLVFNNGRNCISENKSIFDIADTAYDLVYLDPPYITSKYKNETSDYLRCYHFLEGLSMYKDWTNQIDYETKNLRFKNTIASNDFRPTNIESHLEKLIEKFQKSIIVISYKVGGIPTIDRIDEMLRSYNKNVSRFSQHYIYALNKQNGDASKNKEVLLIAT